MKIANQTRRFFYILFLTIAISCGNDIEITEYNDSMDIIECNTDKKIPDGFAAGMVIECNGRNKIEENLLSQFKSYCSALLRGDVDNALHYQFADAAQYYRRFYPEEESNDNVLRLLFEEASKQTLELCKQFESYGAELDFVVSRFVRRVSQGDNIFYVFEIVSNICNDKIQVHTTPDLTLAVSTNNGKNWAFNAMNEDTPNILRINYSNEIVDKVMGY